MPDDVLSTRAHQRLSRKQALVHDYLSRMAVRAGRELSPETRWSSDHVGLLLRGVREVEHLLCEMQELHAVLRGEVDDDA